MLCLKYVFYTIIQINILSFSLKWSGKIFFIIEKIGIKAYYLNFSFFIMEVYYSCKVNSFFKKDIVQTW